ncbi:hypothetical protein BC831DRAFT_459161 [Entophlyctis helioformis]|nr:hypothetical protein BC831DRAFT_459161 [Entophlyctis helioformis]
MFGGGLFAAARFGDVRQNGKSQDDAKRHATSFHPVSCRVALAKSRWKPFSSDKEASLSWHRSYQVRSSTSTSTNFNANAKPCSLTQLHHLSGVPAASNGQKRFVSLAISRDQAAYGDAARYSKNCMPVLSIAQHKAARAAHAAFDKKSEPGRQLRQLLLKAAGAHEPSIFLWLWWIGGWSRWPLHDATARIGWLCVCLCKAFPS